MPTETEAAAVAALTRAATTPDFLRATDGRQYLIHHQDFEADDVSDENLLNVDRGFVKASVLLQSKDSLVEYVNRFKTSATMLFADIAANAITARIDFHYAAGDTESAQPNYDAHRARLVLPHSQEWIDWTKIDGLFMPQKEFARWIEEHPGDIVAPRAADLREVTRDLAALRKVSFLEAVHTNSDVESFTYKRENEVHRDGDVIELPTQFELGIPVYFGEGIASQFAFLRWNIDDDSGRLTLGIKLSRAEYVRQAVFKTIVTDIAERTKTPVVYATG